MKRTPEHKRLLDYRERKANWKNWGPYLSERAWGTVREDYGDGNSVWEYLPHDHARSRTYRWNEDGLMGISDRNQYVCFGLALWNGADPILKERLFGLTGPQGNHGEDVKEYYFYLDSTPTHSYMKMLYKYPHMAYPYADLVAENGRRGYQDAEYELLDTGIFDEDRYFDVEIEYAKADEDDLLIRITATNRGADAATCDVLPQLWFRNTWSWGYPNGPMEDVPEKPSMYLAADGSHVVASHAAVDGDEPGHYFLYADETSDFLFTENETNNELLFGTANESPYVKDAFHRYVISGEIDAINPEKCGSKVAVHYRQQIGAGESYSWRLRLSNSAQKNPFGIGKKQRFDTIFEQRKAEADQFYGTIQNPELDADALNVQRQALAGMLWSKQFYYYDVPQWLKGDPAFPPPPASRLEGRNSKWVHLHNFDLISMPDKWEYPWYATWDSAFHCLPLGLVDPDFAKRQMTLFTREWYMAPNGSLPAYEWSLDDVNPPVHAWATWRLYKLDEKISGKADRPFLEGIFHKLMLNFTWWVNRKDEDDNNIFQGGFLGMDNISVFDRSALLPTGGHLDQSDGTSWMGFYSLTMMRIALELAVENPVYEDMAAKFFEHFLRIAAAMNDRGGQGHALWDEQDQFFYDSLHLPDGSRSPLRVRSLVGLMPLIAIETLDDDLLSRMSTFVRRSAWFMQNRPKYAHDFIGMERTDTGDRFGVALLTRERLVPLLRYMLDENEFLSEYGIRSLSKYHESNPYRITVNDETFEAGYWPAEAQSGLFGGNSNWRGPIWFPINYLIIEALERYHSYYGDTLTVELPTGSGNYVTLDVVAVDLSRRLNALFLRDTDGKRPIYGGINKFQQDPHWRDHVLFYEYFNGDNGAGLGASHQTGWTGLVAKLLQ